MRVRCYKDVATRTFYFLWQTSLYWNAPPTLSRPIIAIHGMKMPSQHE
jgi:hypothetical protein